MKKQCQMMIVAAGLALPVFAQDATDSEQTAATLSVDEQVMNHEGRIAGIEESYADTKTTVEALKKIKISGYVQTQFRAAIKGKDAQTDSMGVYQNKYQYKVGNFAGGAFENGTDNMFQVRRARIKVAYEGVNSQAVVQFDAIPFTAGNALESTNPSTVKTDATTKVDTTITTFNKKAYFNGGGVSVKDAYLRFNEPWLGSIALKAGIFDRPYGFEIGYSSSSRETPERSRMEQTLFPGERDLGASIEYIPADKLPKVAQMFNLRAGLFTGNGINVENDKKLDAIGRVGVAIPFYNINMQIDGGFSMYEGAVTSHSKYLYKMSGKNFVVDSTASNNYDLNQDKSGQIKREYMGADLQIYKSIPVVGGISVRGEFSKGQQPSAAGDVSSPKTNVVSTSDLYVRDFFGWYAMVLQNLDPINCQLVARYDVFDPNTKVTGEDFNKANAKLDLADLKYSTFGGGLIYNLSGNVKLTAYYDHVMNEKAGDRAIYAKGKDISAYRKDLKDDVFTFRIQYKF